MASGVICESFYSGYNQCQHHLNIEKIKSVGKEVKTVSGKLLGAVTGAGLKSVGNSVGGKGIGKGRGGIGIGIGVNVNKYKEVAAIDSSRNGQHNPFENLNDMTKDKDNNNFIEKIKKYEKGEKDQKEQNLKKEKDIEKDIVKDDNSFDGVLRFREYIAATMMKRMVISDERLALCFENLDIGTYVRKIYYFIFHLTFRIFHFFLFCAVLFCSVLSCH